MSDEAFFLREILSSPDDLVPRLVYADWLEEIGDPRGEFIRIQCQRDQLPVNHPDQLALIRRHQELIREHGEEELGGTLPEEVKNIKNIGRVRKIRTCRGFVEKISISARRFHEHADRILELIPLRAIKVGTLPALAMSEQLGRIKEVETDQAGTDLPDFVLSPFLGNLATLIIKTSDVTMGDLEALAASQRLSNLEELVLAVISIGDIVANILSTSRELKSLKSLRLPYCQLSSIGFQTLLGSSRLSLNRLDVSGNVLGSQLFNVAPNATRISAIHCVELGNNALQDEGVYRMVDVVPQSTLVDGSANQLRQLHLQCNLLTDRACEDLANWPVLEQLELLDLRYNPISIKGVRQIANAQRDRTQPCLVLLDRTQVKPDQLVELQIEFGPFYRRALDYP